MSALLLTPPAIEPLSLDEAKAFLRVEHDDDDDVIGALIAGSRIHVEAQTRRALITQTWRFSRDAWPDGPIAILPAPLRTLAAARVYREDGTTLPIDAEEFTLDIVSAPGLLIPRGALPAPGRAVAGIEIDATVGYGDAAADVPEPLRQAIRLLVAHWYENRSVVLLGREAGLPTNVSSLLASYRVLSL